MVSFASAAMLQVDSNSKYKARDRGGIRKFKLNLEKMENRWPSPRASNPLENFQKQGFERYIDLFCFSFEIVASGTEELKS